MVDPAQTRGVLQSIARVRRIFTLGLGLMAVLWLLVIPAFELWQRYSQARTEAQIRLSLVADRVSTYIAANLDTWDFEGYRMAAVVEAVLRGDRVPPSRLVLRAAGGTELAFAVSGSPSRFSVTLEEDVTDGRVPVGRMVMDVPLGDVLAPALASGAIGAASMALLMVLARLIGSKALDKSLTVIRGTNDALAARVEELEEARHQLATQAAVLAEANRDIAHVAQLSAHHLREPLRAVLSYSQLLVRWHEEGGKSGDASSHLAHLRNGVTRMQEQMKALSDYLGLREQRFEPKPLALADALGVANARGPAELSVLHGDLPEVVADARLAVGLLSAVLEQSVRHALAGAPPVVRVEARERDGAWEIRLEDNGRPLAERDPDRMFDLLVHGIEGGMMPGLAKARLSAFLMGGRLWAEDAAGEGGVAYCFTLPRVGQAQPS